MRSSSFVHQASSALLLAFTVSGLACGANMGAGGGGSATRGSQCMELMDAVCTRFASCQVIPADQVALCVQSGVESCCAGNCAAAVASTQADVDRCHNDLNTAGCAVIDITMGGTLPASCQGVVRSALTTTGPATTLQLEETSAAARAGRLLSR